MPKNADFWAIKIPTILDSLYIDNNLQRNGGKNVSKLIKIAEKFVKNAELPREQRDRPRLRRGRLCRLRKVNYSFNFTLIQFN